MCITIHSLLRMKTESLSHNATEGRKRDAQSCFHRLRTLNVILLAHKCDETT